MIRLKNHLLVLFWLLAFALVPSTASAQSPCHLLTSADPIPEGFGAAYNLFSPTQEPLLKVDCGPNITLQVGQGDGPLYIYKTAYEWTGSRWRELALSGENVVGDWYLGSAATNLIPSQAQLAEDNFVVAYTCLRNGSRWKCGCRDTSCSTSHWQLQAFTYALPLPPPSPPALSEPADDDDGGAGGEIQVGAEIEVSPAPVQIRSCAGIQCAVLGTQQAGSRGAVIHGPVRAAITGGEAWWWRVDYESGVDGWSSENLLNVVSGGSDGGSDGGTIGGGATGEDVGGNGINDPGLPENKSLPSPNRMITVSNTSQLTAAINAASPGDHIVLRNGSYGTFTVSRHFPANNRLVIKSQNLHGAQFGSFNLNGNGVIVSGISVAGVVDIRGDDTRFTRSKVDANGSYHALKIGSNGPSVDYREIANVGWGGKRVVVDHNEFFDYRNRGIFFQFPAQDIVFSKNHVHSNRAGSCNSECAAIALGENWYDRANNINAIVRYNYISNHRRGTHNYGDYVHLKASGNTIAFNVFDDTNSVPVGIFNRNAIGTKIIGNTLEKAPIRVQDYDVVVLGNRAPEISVVGGNSTNFSKAPYANPGSPSQRNCITITCRAPGTETSIVPAARNAVLAGNYTSEQLLIGPKEYDAGQFCGGLPAPIDGLAIYNHSQEPTFVDPHYGGRRCAGSSFTWYRDVTNNWQGNAPSSLGSIPEPISFSASAVGPNASTAPRD